MRDEKEGRKKQARSNKQQGKATQHTQCTCRLRRRGIKCVTVQCTSQNYFILLLLVCVCVCLCLCLCLCVCLCIMCVCKVVDKRLMDGADEYLQLMDLCSVIMEQLCHTRS